MRGWARGLWGLVAAVLLLAACVAASVARGQDGGEVPVCCPDAPPVREQAMGTLAVTVQVSAGGGAQPPPGLAPTGPPPLRPAPGVTVQALTADAGAAVVAEAVSDAQGQATLDVPPGQYWVVVPAGSQQGGLPGGGALAMETPAGVRVHAYQEATVGADESVPVALTIRIMLP
jgi:hypothetical protein